MESVAYYIVAQMIGAMLGAFLVWLFKDHFAITDNEGGLACFSTIQLSGIILLI
jgi:glycerol uptake facilitator protein